MRSLRPSEPGRRLKSSTFSLFKCDLKQVNERTSEAVPSPSSVAEADPLQACCPSTSCLHNSCLVNMTTSLRSKAEFQRKLVEFKLDRHLPHFEAEGWSTMQRLAQSCGANPDQVKETTLKDVVEKALKQRGLSDDDILEVRALY